MKKFYFLAIAALGMTVACSKQNVSVPEIDDTTVEAVSFGVKSPLITAAQTRAIGGVDEWTSNPLYIYSFPRTVTDFSEPATDDPIFINNVMVEAASSVVPQNTAYATAEPFYYASDNTCYDFYGYYVDDAAGAIPAPKREADRVYLPVTITGGQDIMLAKASQIEDVTGTGVDPLRAYSAYSARRNVKPTLNFKHQLARFNFYVVAGSESTVGENQVRVKSITIKDAKVNADLNIVGADRGLVDNASSATTADLSLMQKDAASGALVTLEPVGPAEYFSEATERAKKENWTKIGESIMVIPGLAEYTMAYELEQTGVQAPNETKPIALNISKFDAEATAFEAGYQYNVIITIYGLEKVEISTILTPWEDGGDFGYDPDEDWTEPNEIPTTGAAYIYNDGNGASWGKLPVSYRTNQAWNDATVATFPWLAVWFPAVEAGTEFDITVTSPEGDAYPVVFPAYAGTTNKETVITISQEECGATFTAGQWTVLVKDKVAGTTLSDQAITVL